MDRSGGFAADFLQVRQAARGDLNVARIRKSPSIPLFQRGKPVEFSNGKSRLNRDFPLGVNLAATGISPFEKGGLAACRT